MRATSRITPDLLLAAYAQGIFPMAEKRDAHTLVWLSPESRGIVPLDRFHVPKRLTRTVRADVFKVTVNRAFGDVIRACAAPAPGREESWINDEIVALYTALHMRNHAHSVECWSDGKLAGGLYGVSLGAAFFGESMFSRERDASKVALVHLVARLLEGGFQLLDAQFLTEHLSRFGAIAVPRRTYLAMLAAALVCDADFPTADSGLATPMAGERALRIIRV